MSKKRNKHEEHDEHVNHERWLVTYADMITLLMVLFIVLFAMGQTDLAKYKKLRHSLAVGFGGPDKMALLDGGDGINEGGASPVGVTPQEIAAKTALETLEKRTLAWATEKAALEKARSKIEKAIRAVSGNPLIADSQIRVTVTSRGIVITITSDTVLFDPGSAIIRDEGRVILNRIAPQLVSLPNAIAVEGHTDTTPISGTYPSNWELSTARASSVLRSFIEGHGLAASRGTASGYADQRPIESNQTVGGRARNRRVEIVVLAAVLDPNIDSPAAVDAAAKASAAAVSITGDDLPKAAEARPGSGTTAKVADTAAPSVDELVVTPTVVSGDHRAE